MGKIIVLEMGLMGPTIARQCAEEPRAENVKGCDVDDAKLEAAMNFVANRKFETVKLDISDHAALAKVFEDCDVVVNASASKFSIPVLEAAMEADKRRGRRQRTKRKWDKTLPPSFLFKSEGIIKTLTQHITIDRLARRRK